MFIELLTWKMDFTSDTMTPFLLSQIDALRMKDGRKFHFYVDSEDVRKANPERIWTNLRSNPLFEEVIEPDTLDVITQDGIVMRVQGVSDVTRYCRTESPSSVPHTWRQRVVVSKDILPDELSFKVYAAIYEETDLALSEIPSHWDEVPKYYMLKKRFMYKHDDIVVVLNHVRSGTDAFVHMYESDVTRAVSEIELYMEVITPNTEQDMTRALGILSQIMDGTPYPMTKSKQVEVLDGYQRLVDKVVKRRGPGYHFLAPKPVTLEKMNVVDPAMSYGAISIVKGYTVTEKADGERVLLYVHTDGYAYSVNNTMDVRHLGMKVTSPKLHNTIVDGELVTFDKRKDGSRRDLFMAFDIYFLSGDNVMNLPLWHSEKPCRNNKMKSAFDKDLWVPIHSKDDVYIDLEVKKHTFAEGDDMFDACKEILQNAHSYAYEIDGLVFTPAHLGVFGYYPGQPGNISDNVRWDRVFKWKPAEQNSIDFLVEKEDTIYTDPITKKRYAIYKLFTGYNANQWEAISVMNGVRMRYDKSYSEELKKTANVYKTRLFRPLSHYEKGVEFAYVPIGNTSDATAINGDIIRDKSIVEFAYDPSEKGHVSTRWRAMRVREDKTRIFQRTGQLSKTANDLSVAMSIWRTIHSPVTTEMIMGMRSVLQSDVPEDLEERLLGVDDTYYAREVPRSHMLSVHMLNFHNQGIKKMLYQRSSRKEALLELACGMAGDLPRWRDAAYRFVLGVDLVRDNITHPREGSYARVMRQKRAVSTLVDGVEKVIYPDMVFAIGDCALPLHDGSAAQDNDEESRKLLQLVFRKNAVPPQPYMKFIAGRAARGFDVVSCQFAIHYFFQTPEKLHGFLDNVSRNLRKGGIFIATFMDGDRVHNLVSSSSTGVVEGRKLNNTVPVWAIIKKYDTYTQGDEEPFGKKVEVFLENTNRLIPEFLVNMDLLTRYAAGHGLELEDTALFSKTFASLRAAVPADPAAQSKLDKDVLTLDDDEVQKQFSFLNRWVVFRKV